MNRPRVFVSHIHEDAALGTAIKSLVEDVFRAHGVTAFLSSDRLDLSAGRKWLDVITQEIDQAAVVISLLSPKSLGRPWVNIELGAGWIKGLRIIPFCHSGLQVSELPRPFGDFNGVAISQTDAAECLLGGVADGLALAHPQRLDFPRMLAELRTAEAKVQIASSSPAAVGVAPNQRLPAEQVAILRFLAMRLNGGQEYVPEGHVITGAGLTPAVFKHHVHKLMDRKFVNNILVMSAPTEYVITADGSGWLIENGQMPG